MPAGTVATLYPPRTRPSRNLVARLLVAAFLTVLANGSAIAGPSTVRLPPGPDALAWSAAADMVGLTPVFGESADVVVTPGTSAWVVQVRGTDGVQREARVPPPVSQADREEILILAQSLRVPVLAGNLPSATVEPHAIVGLEPALVAIHSDTAALPKAAAPVPQPTPKVPAPGPAKAETVSAESGRKSVQPPTAPELPRLVRAVTAIAEPTIPQPEFVAAPTIPQPEFVAAPTTPQPAPLPGGETVPPASSPPASGETGGSPLLPPAPSEPVLAVQNPAALAPGLPAEPEIGESVAPPSSTAARARPRPVPSPPRSRPGPVLWLGGGIGTPAADTWLASGELGSAWSVATELRLGLSVTADTATYLPAFGTDARTSRIRGEFLLDLTVTPGARVGVRLGAASHLFFATDQFLGTIWSPTVAARTEWEPRSDGWLRPLVWADVTAELFRVIVAQGFAETPLSPIGATAGVSIVMEP